MAEDFEAPSGRLDAVLAARLGVPRAEAQRAIASGSVTVDGIARSKSFRLAGGERVVADLATASAVPAETTRT